MKAMQTDLFGDGRELHNMQCLVVVRGTLVDVDNHGRFSLSTEKALEKLCEFALSERNAATLCPAKKVIRGDSEAPMPLNNINAPLRRQFLVPI